jgi:ribonuclease HI
MSRPPSRVIIHSDSEYALKSILGIYNGPKNRLLLDKVREKYSLLLKSMIGADILIEVPINPLDAVRSNLPKTRLVRISNVSLEYVKGHSGHKWNDRADSLAVAAANQLTN